MGIVQKLGIAGACAATLAVGSLAAVPASAAPADTVVINCLGKGVVKPKQIVLSCADAGLVVSGISWTSWTANDAKGVGTLVWNTCLPQTCANGIVQKFKARVSLGRVASGPSVTVFSQMTLVFANGGPAAADSVTYSLDNELR
jgi:hypothetical protein